MPDHNLQLKEFGSMSTKLLTPFSDMDLVLTSTNHLTKEESRELLQILHENIKSQSMVKSSVPILTATVPILKLIIDADDAFEQKNTANENLIVEEEKSSEEIYNKKSKIYFKMDICAEIKNEYNPESSAIRTTEFTLKCVEYYPTFFKNTLLLKFALNCHNLSNSYKGGLNAYGLGLLYVAYLHFSENNVNQNLGESLVGFLDHFSQTFHPNSCAVFFGNSLEYIN